ncbi:hypothetical protein IWQ62_001666 [Dispira parvispora]|uniref:Arrestin C-terminal-like domain-containing protein n=1 Tax=Dispira parvispora TaxID=1520584 RepID=A0A9W8AXU3_9FUNG|nr:hypothetical protein IWQ62_001666 [Dispira parvispora]
MVVHFELLLSDGVRAQTYRPNSALQGQVSLTIAKELKAQRIRLQLVAEEVVQVRETRKGAPITLTTKERQHFLTVGALVWGSLDDQPSKEWDTIPPGTHRFHFDLKFPAVNFPPSVDKPNVCRVVYHLRASLERPHKLHSLEFTNPVEIKYEPVTRAPLERTSVPVSQSVTTEDLSGTANFTGTISAQTVCPGEVETAAVHIESKCEAMLGRLSCQLVERIECSAQIRGQLQSDVQETVVKSVDPQPTTKGPDGRPVPVKESQATSSGLSFGKSKAKVNPSAIKTEYFALAIPWDVTPAQTKQFRITYHLQFTVEFVDGTLLTAPKRAYLVVPLQVMHQRAKDPHAESAVNYPSYVDSGAVPEFDVKLRTDFLPWDPCNPYWPNRQGGNPQEEVDLSKIPDVATPPDSVRKPAKYSLLSKIIYSTPNSPPAPAAPKLPPRRSSVGTSPWPPALAPSKSKPSPSPATFFSR